jgi:hypothetical protein
MGKRGWVLLAPLAGIGMAVFGQISQQPPTASPAPGEHYGRGVSVGGASSSLGLRPRGAGLAPCPAAPAVAAPPAARGGASGPAPSPEVADPTNLTLSKFWDGVNWIINLLWNDGDGPFTVSYSPSPSFQSGVKTLEKGTSATSTSVTADPGKALEVFDVAGQTALSSAVQGLGYDPEPFPTVNTVSATGFWWGDEVTFTGTYMDSIAASNVAYMMDLPVHATSTTVSGNYATDATFTIPDDARGFWGIVQSHGRSSDYGGSAYVPLPAKGIGPFLTIYGINYVPSNGRFWLAADGAVQQLDLFRREPGSACTPSACPSITGLVKPYISRATSEATPRFLYVDGTLGVTTVHQVNAESGADTTYALTHDTGFTRDIRPVGIAVDPDGSACYVADANGGRVVKIPYNAGLGGSAILDTWGGRTFTFPDPCGIDVNVGHQVVAAHTNGYLYYLYGRSSYTLYGYAGVLVRSLHFDKDYANTSDTFLFYASDPAMAEAFNRNAIGSNPARYHGGIVFGVSDGYIYLEPDWYFYVYRHFPQRVVLNNSGQSADYPTAYQHADRIIEMQMTGWAGRKVQLRVIDPPDLAAYTPDAGWPRPSPDPTPPVPPYEGNDNKGTSDYGVTTAPDGSGAQALITPTVGDDGTLIFYLKVPERYSGDNFQVEVTKCDYSGNVLPERVASLSSVYTSWKRVFVEKDRMFRKGGVLAGDVAQGANTVYLAKTYDAVNSKWVRADNVELNDRIAIFDTQAPFEGAHDEVCVIGLANENDDQVARVTVLLGTMDCQGGYTLARGYMASVSAAGVWDFSTGHSAGVGVIANPSGVPYDTSPNQINAANSAFYDADMRDMEQPYDEAYVEFLGQRSGSGAVPYMPQEWFSPSANVNSLLLFHQLWFAKKSPKADPRFNNPHNYFHLLGASRRNVIGGASTGYSFEDSDVSFIFLDSIAAGCPTCSPSDLVLYGRETVDHELAHQFRVNGCDGTGNGHDNNNAWCGASGGPCANPTYNFQYCIMHNLVEAYSNDMRTSGINHLDCDDLAAQGSACGVPQCTDGISVRTDTDPE